MPDNDSTDKPSERPPLDIEDWELAFAAYKGNHSAALNMGFCLMVIKGYLSYDPPKIEAVLKGIDHAILALYPYTQFHDVCHDMYIKVIGGDLTLEEEEKLKNLGIKF
jgi:hypothetical protein